MTASVAKHNSGNASTTACIPIAGFKDVYDVSDVEKALQELAPGSNEALRAVYDKMLRVGGQRFTVKPSTMPPIDALFDELPNFGAGARGHPQAARPVSRFERPDRAAADAAARRTGHRQDTFCAAHRAAARHRLRLRADELAHRRLDPVRRLLAVEEREARQGIRHLPARRLRQPGDGGRRARQDLGRRPVRPARRAVQPARERRPRPASSTSSSSCRSTPRARCGSRPRTRRRTFRSRSSTA